MTMLGTSYRWKSSPLLDIDAYQLVGGDYFLFFTVKKKIHWDEAFVFENTKDFLGNIAAVSGALKMTTGSEPLPALKEVSEPVICLEADLLFKLESKEVLNPGLFLDQTENRKILREKFSKLKNKKKFLNLFSYTGAFSILAAKAGFEQVTSIDLSRRYLKWDEENTNLNSSLAKHRRICEDARIFIERELKRGNRYNWIVLDPPTFARNGKKIFKVKEELGLMVRDCLRLLDLEPGCGLFVSCNDVQWGENDFFQEMQEIAKEHRCMFEKSITSSGFTEDHGLKGCYLLPQW